MHFSTLVSVAAVLVTSHIYVLGGETYSPPPMSVSSSPSGYPTSSPEGYPTSTSSAYAVSSSSGGYATSTSSSEGYPTSTSTSTSEGYPTSSIPGCVTVTDTAGPSCPTLTCIRPDCILLQTITLECGCASIYHTTECATACGGCATSYDTVYLPCATSVSSPSGGSGTTTTTATSYSMSSPPSYPTTPWGNSTMTTTTSTSIVTISTCPASCTCTGQTTTWSGTTGPTTCPPSSTCSCVLPGGPLTTLTETTVTTPGGSGPAPTTTPGNTGPTPTVAPSGSPTQVQAGGAAKAGSFGLFDGGVLVGLIGAVVGML